jgi:hypothetical protein
VPYKRQPPLLGNRAALNRPNLQHLKRRRSRLLALPLVVLCALAYLGSAAHFAFVQHSVCLEHGESVHTDEVRTAEAEGSFEDSRIARTSQVAAQSHGAEDHCAHTFCRREALSPPSDTVLCVAASPVSGPVLFADVVLPEPVARLRLAPKSSPPRV